MCAYLNVTDTPERATLCQKKMGGIEIVLMLFAIKMKHNQIIIISVFLANWEIVQTVDNSSRTDFGECAAILQVFIPTTKKQGIYYCVANSNVAVLHKHRYRIIMLVKGLRVSSKGTWLLRDGKEEGN